MSTFWSTWVIVLAVVTFGISFLLLCWAPWVRIPTQADNTTTHVWAHGVLREGVQDLPRWWLLVSFAAFFSAALYVVLFPGLGNYRGLLNWTSTDALKQAEAGSEAQLATLTESIRSLTVERLADDPEATRIGRRLFVDNCSGCHGSRAQGIKALGAPNLLDGDWIYGGDAETVMTTILDGRRGAMPEFGSTLGEAGVSNLAHYVASLSGDSRDALKAALGKPLFQACAACHGATGKGNPALGAPNLSDDIWLYGGSIAEIGQTIRNGRGGVMPPWRDRLGEDNVKLIAAWLHGAAKPSSAAR
jgi:cytochrome c oxidase cbb3-type subunit 3